MRQHSPRLASRGAKLSRREKHWKRRVVEHSVLASTIVSLEFLDLSAISIRFGRFLVCGHRTPFLPIASWADLTKVRKASRAPESLEGTRGPVPSFLVHMESVLGPAVLQCGNDGASRQLRICRGLTQ